MSSYFLFASLCNVFEPLRSFFNPLYCAALKFTLPCLNFLIFGLGCLISLLQPKTGFSENMKVTAASILELNIPHKTFQHFHNDNILFLIMTNEIRAETGCIYNVYHTWGCVLGWLVFALLMLTQDFLFYFETLSTLVWGNLVTSLWFFFSFF